jgi:hypothetical protein
MARQRKSRSESAPVTLTQFRDLFTAYRKSVGNYHGASRGADSARAAGVIDDCHVALVHFAVRAGWPTMPPDPPVNCWHGDWSDWGPWLRRVDHWGVEVEARIVSASRPVDTKKDNAEKVKLSYPRNLQELKAVTRKVCKDKQQGMTQEQSVREFVEENYPELTTEERILKKRDSLIRSLNRYKHVLKPTR